MPRDFVGYGRRRPRIEWPGGARLALSLVINFEEGSERTPLLGDTEAEPKGEGPAVPAGTRNLINESMFNYGSRAGCWRLLDLMDVYEAKVTVFACGMALELHPEAAAELTRRGHEVAGHGYRWQPIHLLSPDEERDHLHRAVDSIRRTTGERPVGWFSVDPSVHTREMLVEEGGFVYDSDSFSDDLPYFVRVRDRKWLILPYDLVNNDALFTRPPGHAEPDDFFVQLKDEFDWRYAEGATAPQMMSVGLHMRITGRPSRIKAVDDFLRYVRGVPRVWIARRVDIARWWLDRYGDLPAVPED